MFLLIFFSASLMSLASGSDHWTRSLVSDPATFARQSYDFVIAGGGVAGLTIAARLSENPNVKVAVIEAGQYLPDDDNVNIPGSQTFLLGNSKYDWAFTSVPQSGANGHSLIVSRGKLVGGSSGINNMVWQRGNRENYDAWSNVFGNDKTWSWDGLLPYFKKPETWNAPQVLLPNEKVTPGLRAAHGTNGPIKVSYNNFLTEVDAASYAAVQTLGLPIQPNPDDGDSVGFPNAARDVDPTTGNRSYAAMGYFKPNIGRPNISLLTGAQVTTINFSTTSRKIVASGLNFVVGGKMFTVRATKEVILSAGSLKSPQILELSGVGNATLLKSLGIKAIVDLPGVGENLQDQPLGSADFNLKPGTLTLASLQSNQTFLAEQTKLYETNHTGALTYTPPIFGLVPLQRITTPSRFQSILSILDKQVASTKLTPIQKLQYKFQRSLYVEGKVGMVGLLSAAIAGLASSDTDGTARVTLLPTVLQPLSRGSVHITTTNLTAPPRIDYGFLSYEVDVEVMVEGLKFTRRWSEAKPLSDFVVSPNAPPANVTNDDDLRNYARNNPILFSHASGSTAMAPKNIGGVVDSNLKVYGLDNVRVIDAGIIPVIPCSTTMPTTYAIAEKASDMIKAQWHIQVG